LKSAIDNLEKNENPWARLSDILLPPCSIHWPHWVATPALYKACTGINPSRDVRPSSSPLYFLDASRAVERHQRTEPPCSPFSLGKNHCSSLIYLAQVLVGSQAEGPVLYTGPRRPLPSPARRALLSRGPGRGRELLHTVLCAISRAHLRRDTPCAKGPDRSCSITQAGRLCVATPCATAARKVFVEVLQQHGTPMPPIRPCPSCNLAACKVFVEMLEPWAVALLQR
jgi:hypothetical protein